MGRPTKLTRTLLDQLEQIADDTWSIRDACQRLEIAEGTWRSWEAGNGPAELIADFLPLASRVRESSAAKTDDLAWGTLRRVLDDPAAKHSDLIAAASTILRLRTAHRVELTGKDGGAVEVDTVSARHRLVAQLEEIARRRRELEAGISTPSDG